MTISAPFSSESEADRAYFGDDGGDDPNSGGGGGGGGGSGGTGSWGELQTKETDWSGGWVLTYQDATDGPETRWFVLRQDDAGNLQFLNESGKPESLSDNAGLDQAPHFSLEDDARAAYQKWAKANGAGGGDGSADPGWSKWQRVKKVDPWTIFGRAHKEEDRTQFMVGGVLDAGDRVYLDKEGRVVDAPVIFDSVDATKAAVEAYFKRVNNGEVPDDRQPNGEVPSREGVAEDARKAGAGDTKKGGDPLEKLLAAARENPGLAGAAAVGAAYIYKEEIA